MGKLTDLIEKRRWVERTRDVFPGGVEVTLSEGYTFRDLQRVRVFTGPILAERGTTRAHVIQPAILFVAATYRDDGFIWVRRSDGATYEKLVACESRAAAVRLIKTTIGVPCSED